jgi:hypothetical protein
MLKMVAQGHAQHLFCFILPDDKPVEMGFDVVWLEIEVERCRLGSRRLGRWFSGGRAAGFAQGPADRRFRAVFSRMGALKTPRYGTQILGHYQRRISHE